MISLDLWISLSATKQYLISLLLSFSGKVLNLHGTFVNRKIIVLHFTEKINMGETPFINLNIQLDLQSVIFYLFIYLHILW